jgi:hypothetical protein
MNCLRQLLADTVTSATDLAVVFFLPHLPLLIAQDLQWSFLFAFRQAEDTTVSHRF